jgi:predicted NUDIX family phosphoesterase
MEKVFCINRKNLESVMGSPLPQGTFSKPDIETVMCLGHEFIPKQTAENDDSQKQIIPYQLFSFDNKFFVYKRGKKIGESRLAERYSIGIGGHINSDDFNGIIYDKDTNNQNFIDFYKKALLREREEELHNLPAGKEYFLGWINDDTEPVGRVHLGAIHLTVFDNSEEIKIKEKESLHFVGWWDIGKILENSSNFETWSVLSAKHLAGLNTQEYLPFNLNP